MLLNAVIISTLNLQLVISKSIAGVALNNTLTLGFSVPWEQGWPVGPYLGSAIVVGIREVKRRQLINGYDIEWVMRDDYCEPRRGTQVTVDMWASVDDLDGIIGPACSVVCQTTGLLAAAWGIPTIGWACASSKLSDKDTYPTFTRVEGTWLDRAPAYDKLADLFGWETIGIITTPEDLYRLTSVAILEEMEKNGKSVHLQVVHNTMRGNDIDLQSMQDLKGTIQSMKVKTYIFIIMGYPLETRNMLITCLDLGMMNGEFAFIIKEFILAEMENEHSFRPEADLVIWNGVLGMGVQTASGPAWDTFRQDVINAFVDPHFENFNHLGPSADIEEVNPYAGLIHDAVLLWAYGVNKTLEQGHPPDDGFRIAQNNFNIQFKGISGAVVINDVGDRLPDLKIVMVQETVITLAVWISAEQRYQKKYIGQAGGEWSGLLWPGNASEVPKDRPMCGWDNKLNDEPGKDNNLTLIITGTVTCVVMIVMVTVGIGFVRKYKYEVNLRAVGDVTVRWEDLDFDILKKNAKSIGSIGTEISRIEIKAKKGLKIVNYQGVTSVIHHLGQDSLNLKDRKVLKDIQEMRSLHHDNINAFTGICPISPNTCYLMAFAQRGTLQDILSDDEQNITNDFKVSFTLDIVYGMWYLHQTSLMAHGHLTSSKCVVDNRWIVKITGHGLRNIRYPFDSMQFNSNTLKKNPSKLLWKAPELLRNNGELSKLDVQRGDVFSFSIITQEIFLKDSPYAANEPDIEPGEIIDRIRMTEEPPYRPVIPKDTCPEFWEQLMKACWQETPEQRPTFKEILVTINKHHESKTSNLVDNMVKRLEKHTHNLEDRVSVRTRELIAEKGKVEILLQELLPPSVADSLSSGRQIEPEVFANVTVFFSDIVGFTRISAVATPMETVVMLNAMYTMFDDISRYYDVYKVATIGDAYLVASGVPIRNEDKHASEICSMALGLIDALQGFVIGHLPDEHLCMRIGIHSGPCVAGVIGLKMPRYLLFGDTVDIAAKLESGGESMRIQISEDTQSLIKSHSHFYIEKRGRFNMVGRREMTTYWLNKSM